MMNSVRLLSNFSSGLNIYGAKLMKVSQCGGKTAQLMISRMYSQEGREVIWKTHRARRKSFAEAAAKPVTKTAITVGQGAVAGAAAFGIGALCYYGLGFSNQAGILEQSMLWPQYVRERVRDTYLYFGSSLVVTTAAAVVTFKNPILLNFASKTSLLAIGVTLAAMMGTGLYTMSLDYTPTFNAKHVGWILHSCLVGAVIAPLALMGGAPIIQALWYTGAVIGSLTTIAACAPNDRFLFMSGPIAACMGLVFISALGTLFIPASTALGSGLAVFTVYGGLIIFSGMFLYDTQRIVRMAETHPVNSSKPFDPINASISIYMDTVNIFVRLVQIFGISGGKK